ncbi:LADA_0F01618g1_1 [Lachancea dasiensis]|uniref:Spindle pole body component n=1 Tax=Lachancea dasiensis TaxID=1072105 RepID=A0A1G4JI46_9SACH|nr:LADA_0F01618g1_1 [Lachancea dasiensis]
MEVRNNVEDVCFLELTSENEFLSRLVNFQPLTSTQIKVKSYPLEQIKNARVQEALVVRDLLNVLVGMEGVYIRYNNSYEPRLGPGDEIRGPDFKIAKNMDPSLKSFAKWMVKFGKIYVVLSCFSERYNEPVYGSILHRLCYEIRQFLAHDYMRFIVDVAEGEFRSNPSFSIRELGQMLTKSCGYKAQLLYDIVQDVIREMSRRALMNREEADFHNFIQDLKKEKHYAPSAYGIDSSGIAPFLTDSRINIHARGGVILQMVQDRLKGNWGNQRNVDFLQKLLSSISSQYCVMLETWLTNGSLSDPHDEFMVADSMRSTSHQEITTLNSLNSERLWDTQHVIRRDGIMEQFKEKDIAFKVLMTGKLLNLFRQCCDFRDLTGVTPANSYGPLRDLPQGTQLTLYVDAHYKRANELVGGLFCDGYNLANRLGEFHQNFFFYNNPSFFRSFFNRSLIELTKLRSDVVQEKLQRSFLDYQLSQEHRTSNIVLPLLNLKLDHRSFYRIVEQFSSETANGGNEPDLLQAQNFGNLRDMLLRDLELQDLDSGTSAHDKKFGHTIHHLQFEIIVPFPLNTIITKTCMVQYQMVQRYLGILHYYNKILQDTWFELNKNRIWRHAGFSKDVKHWIRRCRTVHFRMTQFMKFVLEYTCQDVIHSSWAPLKSRMDKNAASNFDLNACQLALQDFLTQIMAHSLLTNASLVRLLIQITDIVHRFCKFVTSLRKTLCMMDVRLFSYYQGQFSDDHQYDEAAALRKLHELQKYLGLIWDSFSQHRSAFAEGVSYYCNNGSVRSGASPVIFMAEKLKFLEK